MSKMSTDHLSVPPNSNNSLSKRNGDIEVLRALAVLLVLYEHADLDLMFWHSHLLQGAAQYFRGWAGVDLFFAISGFVIARSLLPILACCSNNDEFLIKTCQFWIRRAWRLLPSAWLWLLIPLIFCVVFNRSGVFMTLRTDVDGVIAAMLDVANFRLGMTFGKMPVGNSFIYWSLSLEEQFYFILPLAAFVLGRRLWILLGLIVVLQFLIAPNSLTIALRGAAISLGVLLALWQTHKSYYLFEPTPLANHQVMRLASVGIPLLFITMLASYSATIVQFPIAMIAMLSGLLVWLASYDRNYICRNGILKHMFLWIGARSYAIYLIHLPVYLSLHEIWFRTHPMLAHPHGLTAAAYVFAAYLIIFGLSDLNYRLLETPLRKRGAEIALRFGAKF